MKHGSLFSGIGGFDLAAQWMGWENVFHCEWNTFGQKVLKYYWPEAISYDDITKTDFTIHRGEIDILTGGFPCQPYSTAGKRKGKEDDRHLWPEMLRSIREIQPRWVVGENVRGLVNWNGGLVFDEVQADLEAEGYEVTSYLLPACAVNAPHRRDRIWFIAYSRSEQLQIRPSIGNESNTEKKRTRMDYQPGPLRTAPKPPRSGFRRCVFFLLLSPSFCFLVSNIKQSFCCVQIIFCIIEKIVYICTVKRKISGITIITDTLMNYALEILEAEKRMQEWHINRLEKKVWSPLDDIPPTLADRKRKLKDINEAIQKLKA